MPGSDRPRRPRQGREGAVALDGRSDRAQKEHLHVAHPQLSWVCSIVCEGSGMPWTTMRLSKGQSTSKRGEIEIQHLPLSRSKKSVSDLWCPLRKGAVLSLSAIRENCIIDVMCMVCTDMVYNDDSGT